MKRQSVQRSKVYKDTVRRANNQEEKQTRRDNYAVERG